MISLNISSRVQSSSAKAYLAAAGAKSSASLVRIPAICIRLSASSPAVSQDTSNLQGTILTDWGGNERQGDEIGPGKGLRFLVTDCSFFLAKDLDEERWYLGVFDRLEKPEELFTLDPLRGSGFHGGHHLEHLTCGLRLQPKELLHVVAVVVRTMEFWTERVMSYKRASQESGRSIFPRYN